MEQAAHTRTQGGLLHHSGISPEEQNRCHLRTEERIAERGYEVGTTQHLRCELQPDEV
jgi:hypothetical protein